MLNAPRNSRVLEHGQFLARVKLQPPGPAQVGFELRVVGFINFGVGGEVRQPSKKDYQQAKYEEIQ